MGNNIQQIPCITRSQAFLYTLNTNIDSSKNLYLSVQDIDLDV